MKCEPTADRLIGLESKIIHLVVVDAHVMKRPTKLDLTRLAFFTVGKTSIEESSQGTARLLSQDSGELTFVEPDAFTVFAAIQIES